MWIVACGATLFGGLIGFYLGRLRPKVCARAARRAFRGLFKPKGSYLVPREAALSYLVELEKQEIDIRKTALQQMTMITIGALAVSGGLALKHMIMFHWLAIMMYIIALISGYIGTCSLADYRRKRANDVLISLDRSKSGQVSISRKNGGTPIFVKLTMFVMYLFFIVGVAFTTNAFFARGYCDGLPRMMMNAGERFMCDLVISSKYLAAQEEN